MKNPSTGNRDGLNQSELIGTSESRDQGLMTQDETEETDQSEDSPTESISGIDFD